MGAKKFECSSCGAVITLNTKPMRCPCGKSEFSFLGVSYTDEEYNHLKEILKNPNLFNRVIEEVSKKVVGEKQAIQVIFLCANGRLVENHQVASYNLDVEDESGKGKDYVVDKTLEIIPSHIRIKKSRISPTVFTYWHNSKYEPHWTWQGKVFYCEDISEGVLNSDVFKVMCSSGSSATITIKQRAVDREIKGKPVIITTSASANPNPELIRRFALLQLDGSIDQTREIMRKHAEFKKQGIVPEYDSELIEAQNLLEQVKVRIPFAEAIFPHLPENNIIMRTNFPRFLDFIAASTALHQFQRESIEGFHIADARDYELARQCFLTLFSNRHMIPLTHNQRQLLSYFEKDPVLTGSVSQFYNEKGMRFMSDRALETNLKILVKYGILTTKMGKDSLNRDMVLYSLNASYPINEKLTIPTFEQIMASMPSETSVTKIDTEDKEVSEARNEKKCSICKLKEGMLTSDGVKYYCEVCANLREKPIENVQIA